MPLFKGIYYQTAGYPRNPAVLFFHGFMGNSKDWHTIISKLSKSYFCISIDLPGHGASINRVDLGEDWGFEPLRKKIADLTDYLNLEHLTLLGYSMGGRIALDYMANNPARITKLILESASPGLKSAKEKKLRRAEDEQRAQQLLNIPLASFLEQWYQLPLFRGLQTHDDYKNFIKQRLENNPTLLARALLAYSVAGQADHLKNLKTFNKPIALFCGEKDPKYTELYSSINKQLPNSRLYIIHGCSHNTHFGSPNLFAVHLTEFLSL